MKLFEIIFLFCAVLILSPSLVFAQADFLQKGESGISMRAGYAEGNDATEFQVAALGILGGIFDFGVAKSSISSKNSYFSSNSTIYHVGVYPLREDTSKNITINLGLFGEYSSVRGDDIGIVGISIFKRSSNINSFFSKSKFSVIKVFNLSSSIIPSEMAYQLDFTIGQQVSTTIIYTTLSFLKGQDATIVGLTAGFAIALESGH